MPNVNHFINQSVLPNAWPHTLSEILEDDSLLKVIRLNPSYLYSSFVKELKQSLETDDLRDLIQKIYKVEKSLTDFSHKFPDELEVVPSLDEFYRTLSPTLLQIIWEYLEFSKKPQLGLLEGLLEALRIAVEEEICIWQEKVFVKE